MGFIRASVYLKVIFTAPVIVAAAFLAAAFLTVEAVSANWSSEEAQTRKHIVRSGETLSVIAQNYGFELKELIQYNKMSNPTRLQVGQVIYFPEDITPKTKTAEAVQPTEAKVVPLNTIQFPPESAKPTVGDYYQLQQFTNTPTNKVDYNYIQKQTPEREKPDLSVSLATPEPEAEMTSVNKSKANASDLRKEEVIEKIEDDASPALSAFGERPYTYFGNGEELVDVIQNFAASYYIPTSISEDVVGEINGKIGPLTPVNFLDHMANIYGFIWYFDGHTLYVYSGNSAQQKIISLSNISVDQFKKTLKNVGIWDGRFFWKSQQEDGLVFISGPPRYVEMVSQTALLLDEKEGERQKNDLTVRMFRLKYAWATDKTFPFRGQEIKIPGVATILQNIINGGGVAKITKQSLPNPSLGGLKGATLAADRKASEKKAADTADALNEGAVAETVYINADPRLNAIIVHDLATKMPMYQELIASLDKPTSQIEVTVSIIDMNTEDVDALGVEWSRQTPITGTKGNEISFNPFPVAETVPAFTTIIQTNIGAFNAKLSLLAQEGKIKVVSRPSILTLDNLEAVLDNSDTFYVSVAGERDAELFPVTSGTVVQVTPRIIHEEKGRRIHMNVNIQDGTGAQAEGQTLPTVTKSSISTQAIIYEQESLLIGGFYKERAEELSTEVPVLGKIPILGHLFRSQKNQKSKQVRLFLITPRIVGIERT